MAFKISSVNKLITPEVKWKVSFVIFNVAIFVLLVYFTLLLIVFLKDDKIIRGSDFVQYYTGGLIVRSGQAEKIYDVHVQSEVQNSIFQTKNSDLLPFRSLPFVGLAFAPLTRLPFYGAFSLFLIFNLALICLIVYLTMKYFKNIPKYLILILPLAYYPFILTLIKGQVDIILTLSILLTYLFAVKKRNLLAGIMYSLLLIKPHFFLVGLSFFLLLVKDRKFFWGIVCGSIIFGLFSLIVSGFGPLMYYPSFIFLTETPLFKSSVYSMFSLDLSVTAMSEYLGLGPLYVRLIVLTLYTMSFAYFIRKVSQNNFEKFFLISVIFMIIFAVHVLPYDCSILFVPILIIFNKALSQSQGRSYKLLLLGLLVMTITNIEIVGSHLLNSVIMLLAAVVLLVKKDIWVLKYRE